MCADCGSVQYMYEHTIRAYVIVADASLDAWVAKVVRLQACSLDICMCQHACICKCEGVCGAQVRVHADCGIDTIHEATHNC